jgi:hypothetical protein
MDKEVGRKGEEATALAAMRQIRPHTRRRYHL